MKCDEKQKQHGHVRHQNLSMTIRINLISSVNEVKRSLPM